MKVCLDSRLVKKGEHFVAVRGDTFDGHKFIPQALNNGAAGVLEEKELYQIAKNKLNQVKPLVVGIAGSVGKSTFRSYLVSTLSKKLKVLDGNLNTKLGLAVNIVNNLNSDHKVIVAELGIDRLGEMEQVVNFIQPDFSVITKLEKEHLEFLKSLDNVVKENFVAVQKSRKRLGYINFSDKALVDSLVKTEKIKYFPSKSYNFGQTDLPDHEKDYLSCVKQICIEEFGFTKKDVENAVLKLSKPKGRLNIIPGRNGSTIIDDSYNAVCDKSVTKGIEYALNYSKKYGLNLTIILSPLRETGVSSKEQHKNVAKYLNKINFKSLLLVGEDSSFYSPFLKRLFNVLKESTDLKLIPESDDVFYVKGAQFYRTERCVKVLMKNPEDAKKLLVRQDATWL